MRAALLLVWFGAALLGCDSSAEQPGGESSVATARDADEIAAQIPVVQFDGQQVDDPAPYLGSQDESGGAADAAAGFSPAPADQAFCRAVSVINARPQPRDEYGEVVVANQYFAAIERYVPPELSDEFGLVLQFTESVVEAGSFAEADELPDSDEVATALAALDEFVDRRCLGRP